MYFNSVASLELALSKVSDRKEIYALAKSIIEGAKSLEWYTAQSLEVHPAYLVNDAPVIRNYEQPIEYNHHSIVGAVGADDSKFPLITGEQWNEGRRATNTGIQYKFNTAGLPINPYLNTGLTGRGLLWLYGPNHAVDNGILTMKINKRGENALHAIGIHHKDQPLVPSLSGGFAKFKKTENGFIFDKETVLFSLLEEFFEELMSGSVELEPSYKILAEQEFQTTISARMSKRTAPLENKHLDEIKEQAIVAAKITQVKEKDPEFFVRLLALLETGQECFAGPVLNAYRSTNNAWVETRLSWIFLDKAALENMKGNSPRYNYGLVAGDDAASIHYFEIGKELIENANKSHAPLFAFMAAAYLIDRTIKGLEITKTVHQQLEEVAEYLGKFIEPARQVKPKTLKV